MTLTCIVSFLFRFSFKGLGIQKWRFVETKDIFTSFLLCSHNVGAPHILKKKTKISEAYLESQKASGLSGLAIWRHFTMVNMTWSTWSIWPTRSIWSILLKGCHSVRVHCLFIFATRKDALKVGQQSTEEACTIQSKPNTFCRRNFCQTLQCPEGEISCASFILLPQFRTVPKHEN